MILRITIAFAASSWSYPPQTRTSFLSVATKRKQKMHSASGTLAKTHLQLEKTARKTRGRSNSSGLESFLIVNVPAKEAQDRLKMNSVLFISGI
jgi:hypothetical protein